MLTFTYTTRPASFIPSSLQVTVEELRVLEAKGFDVKLFTDKPTCNNCYPGMEENTRKTIADLEGHIKREKATIAAAEGTPRAKLYKFPSYPHWEQQIQDHKATLASCGIQYETNGPIPLPWKHLRDVLPAGGKRRAKTHRKKITKHRRKTQHRRK